MYCGSEIDNKTGFCPNCDKKSSSKNRSVLIIIVIVLIIVLIIFGIYYAAKNSIVPVSKNSDNKIVQNTSHYYSTKNGDKDTENSSISTTIPEKISTTEDTTVTETETHITNSAENNFLFLSDTELLTEEYLDTKSKNEIDLIRNEIYARHGYIFKMEQYYNYFIQKSWYKPTEPNMDKAYDSFNSIEKQNIEILVEYQNLG